MDDNRATDNELLAAIGSVDRAEALDAMLRRFRAPIETHGSDGVEFTFGCTMNLSCYAPGFNRSLLSVSKMRARLDHLERKRRRKRSGR
jgi:hypothetical protein